MKYISFICECPLYNVQRNILHNHINIPNIDELSTRDTFINFRE